MAADPLAITAGFEMVRPRAVSKSTKEVTQERFDRLLKWLHSDREEAGRLYEQIRRRLIMVFASRGCECAEELADETIDRVAGKAEQVVEDYEGDPALYFYGVARNVHREYRKVKRIAPPPAMPAPADEASPELDCLDGCMSKLLPKNRELIVEYYQEDKQAKIVHRKALADRYGIDMNALRIRAHRIRTVVADCTTACLQRRSIQ